MYEPISDLRFRISERLIRIQIDLSAVEHLLRRENKVVPQVLHHPQDNRDAYET